jgi:hypothetical protein
VVSRVCGVFVESELTRIGAETQIPIGAGVLANAVGQIEIRRLTQPVRQQAGSYRSISTQPQNDPVGPASAGKASVAKPQNRISTSMSSIDAQARVCGVSVESELAEIDAETHIPVGAGLLANAFSQPPSSCQTHRVRQQAGSYKTCPPVETTVADPTIARAHAPRGYASHDAQRPIPANADLTVCAGLAG